MRGVFRRDRGGYTIGSRFFAFYWTLPVNVVGFRRLPGNGRDIDAAAAASRTIRYQRELIRRWIGRERGRSLIGETSSLSLRPDSAHFDPDDLDWIDEQAVRLQADVVVVGFRRSRWLRLGSEELRLERDWHEIEPEKLQIDGAWFDPDEHFASWLDTEKALRQRLASDADAALRRLATEIPPGRPLRSRLIAEKLAQEGVATVTGRRWTEDNVRKALKVIEGAAFDGD